MNATQKKDYKDYKNAKEFLEQFPDCKVEFRVVDGECGKSVFEPIIETRKIRVVLWFVKKLARFAKIEIWWRNYQ